MKALLKIGYYSILLPDDKGITTILNALTKGVRVDDHLYHGKLEIAEDQDLDITIKLIPAKTKIIDKRQSDKPLPLLEKTMEDHGVEVIK